MDLGSELDGSSSVQERAAEPILGARPMSSSRLRPLAERLRLPSCQSRRGSPEADLTSVGCICVSPLKALINDQANRLTPLFDRVKLPLTPGTGT